MIHAAIRSYALALLLPLLLLAPSWLAAQGETAGQPEQKQLRVCSDPNNLPFSNRREQGFENKIAELIAKEWGGMEVTYTWWPQRRGFVRETLRAKKCDVIIGVPQGYDPVASTEPYYASTYVFVYPADKGWDIKSLDDEILKKLRIGVNLIGDDYMNPPPVMAMADRGLFAAKGYSIYGDYSQESPPREIMDALGKGEVDVAIVWGPLAGYFAKQQPIRLKIVHLPPSDRKEFPFQFNMSMGIRRGDKELQKRLEQTLKEKRAEIHAILEEYGVPLVPLVKAPLMGEDDEEQGKERQEAAAPAQPGSGADADNDAPRRED